MILNKAKKSIDQVTVPKPITVSKQKEGTSTERMLTMQEAMDYLSDRGVPCRSRATFYRILKDFNVPYVNVNPHGKHEVRRFANKSLKKILEAKGLNS